VERRETELRDDIELMIKMELGGSLANIQTSIENSLSRIEQSIDVLGQRVGTLESKAGGPSYRLNTGFTSSWKKRK
jgi:hypothetical protein